ncbi:hypothetical protein NUW58_g419 [Xylaria curta]|uniref:Uncharacterized protein n=1 Tax=Xylaria curta TaxID=42375 RepID=A0ACC1PR31_9PEZI|nr:hypothetical protein NUW58_g419 [Xylaria curta]
MNGLVEPITQYDGGKLQNQNHRHLLDVIDSLRSQGISRYIDLPQIIVCGDQSSGKSSVLEAISGFSFPTKDNLCTRFATELILRRNPTGGHVEISILPGHERTEEEKTKLSAFHHHQETRDISKVIEAAKQAMGIDSGHKAFSTDVLRVEISGPTQPHLTMVDLPGLFSAGNKDQSEDDAKLVEDLVVSYMKRDRSIILAVVSAKSDFALQGVTRHAREHDPRGIRTLGLITKPDTLDVGSESERSYIELAQNRDVQFRLGWHVLRNRNYDSRNASTAERNQTEAEFFSTGAWRELNGSQLGVASLQVRLSNILHQQIGTHLPSVVENVEAGIRECNDKLSKLGAARSNLEEQRRHLFQVSMAFTNTMNACIDGNYTDPFFNRTDTPSQKRLRAVVQNTLIDFAKRMHTDGHARIILEDEQEIAVDSRSILRSEYVKEVKVVMKENRGRELPGSYNPLIVAELFSKQCKPWEKLVYDLGDHLLQSAHMTIGIVLCHVADEETAAGIARVVVIPWIEKVKKDLDAKLGEILDQHLSGHPITYNNYLTENSQRAQDDRKRKEMEKRLQSFLDKNGPGRPSPFLTAGSNIKPLLDALMPETEPDMDEYSCYMAVDMMEAYYKVALKTVIDELPRLFSPDIVYDLTDEEVRLIAAESEISVAERERLNEKLVVLQRGLTQLGKFKQAPTLVVPENSLQRTKDREPINRPGGKSVNEAVAIDRYGNDFQAFLLTLDYMSGKRKDSKIEMLGEVEGLGGRVFGWRG